MPIRRRSWPNEPAIWPEFEGRPGVLGVRKRLVDAEKDDFWKVRKAGFSLLMGMVGDAKPIAFVEDTAVDPTQLPGFLRPVPPDRRAARSRGGLLRSRRRRLPAHPPLDQCQDAGRRGNHAVDRREVSDLVVEFGGAMSGEHGDGLARSLWNRKLFGPEIYAAFQAIKYGSTPRTGSTPARSWVTPIPARSLRIGPDYHPHSLTHFPGLLRPGGVRPGGRDVLGSRRVPQDRKRNDVPQLYGHTGRNPHDARSRQPPPPGDDRRITWPG